VGQKFSCIGGVAWEDVGKSLATMVIDVEEAAVRLVDLKISGSVVM
jgi:hypothetical protein